MNYRQIFFNLNHDLFIIMIHPGKIYSKEYWFFKSNKNISLTI